MNYCETKPIRHLEYNQLLDEYILGCKSEQKIGLEYERIPLNNSNGDVASYYGDYGICEFLRELAKTDNWDYILDDINIIGLKKLHDTITLEPGCQVELSLEPQNTIFDIKNKIEKIDSVMQPILDKFGITLINKGVSPKTTYKNIKLLPKRRYAIMANYLWGILSDVMMRETAGIQVGIDYKSEEDAMKKFRLSNVIMPFITAMFANSKIRGGVDTGYKSFRALAWLNTDNERCGFATKFEQDLSFKDYVNKLLDTPMIFIMRENKPISINGRLTFKQFMEKGFEGFKAEIQDWKFHSNLYFPEVRLRNFIEIRNHDCVGNGLEYAIPAFYKGIMYNSDAFDAIEKITDNYSYNEINELRYSVPRYAVNAKIKKQKISDICLEFLKISYQSLQKQNTGEEVFLERITELIKKGKVPADIK